MIVQAFQALLSRYPEHSNFYTDASKSEDKVGQLSYFRKKQKDTPYQQAPVCTVVKYLPSFKPSNTSQAMEYKRQLSLPTHSALSKP
ncbi:hypothetical protein JTB14_024922 [Gonioctena quinquepunctata]|nr:hypothetical protein JTB14_024922 [Gonioctena quinquepunctata]